MCVCVCVCVDRLGVNFAVITRSIEAAGVNVDEISSSASLVG